MIKINKWFPEKVLKKYGSEMLKKIQKKMLEKDSEELTFIEFGNVKYTVNIESLLVSPLKDLKAKCKRNGKECGNGIDLYITLCELKTYKNLSEGDAALKKIKAYDKEIYEYLEKQNLDEASDGINWAALTANVKKALFQCICPGGDCKKSYIDKDNKPKSIIHYDMLDDELRHKLMLSLGLMTCPYCNRQYITHYTNEKGNQRTTADLDHFYQKSIYPLFALSLFNFIPSCQICNSRMKGEKQQNTLYPYKEGFGDKVKFCLKPKDNNEKDLLKLWLGDRDVIHKLQIDFEFCEKLDEEFKERVEGSIELFKLKQVYDIHKEKALDIILKKRIYENTPYTEYMRTLMGKLKLSFTDEDIINILVGYRWKDENYDEPLSKFVHDIFYFDEYSTDIIDKK